MVGCSIPPVTACLLQRRPSTQYANHLLILLKAPRSEPTVPLFRPTINRNVSHSTKISLISPTPSVEADDEREESSLSEIDFAMGDIGDHGRYPDEDNRPTSQKELYGWYSYGWAAETFVIVCMSSFLPITLEQLARENGVLLSDKTTPCSASWSSGAVDELSVPHRKELPPCVVRILGSEINTASFAMYTFSISVLVQALLIISMSGAADHGRFRKSFLLVFAFIGSISTMLFIGVVPKLYLFGALLAIIGNTCFGASFVLLNSFLPLLVRHHPSIIQSQQTGYNGIGNDDHLYEAREAAADATTPLLPADRPDGTAPAHSVPAAVSPELRLSTQLSSYGIGIGYIAGLVVQSVAILIVVGTGSTTFSLRLVLLLAGSWWFLFSIPAALWLRPRPGPPLPAEFSGRRAWVSYIIYAWKALFKTIGRARRLKDIVIFLGAWFLLSDSIATVSGTAVLFAKTTLGMHTAALGLINVIATIAGVIGAFSWSYVSRVFNLRASQTIVACVCLFELIPLYGLLGFIPAVKNWGVIGLQQPWEMYPLGAVYGLVLGGLSSYCRSFFGELIPPGFEAAFYALYAITDKGSSIFGPAIVGAITDRYGEIRPAFVFLAVLIALPLPLMLLVNVDRGKAEAATLAAELEGKHPVNTHPTGFAPIPAIRVEDDVDGQGM